LQKKKYANSIVDDSLKKEDNEFLLNYIMEGKWRDNNDTELDYDEDPTSNNIVYGDSDDEKQLKENDFFEAAYNFRYEQDGANQVVTYPRNIDNSARKKDTKRKETRERHKKNKEEQEYKKREELKRLKNLKKMER